MTEKQDAPWESGAVVAAAERIVDFFERVWQDGPPLARLLHTGHRGYLYDTGTSKLFGCHEREFALLSAFFRQGVADGARWFSAEYGEAAFQECGTTLMRIVTDEDILKCSRVERFGLGEHYAAGWGEWRENMGAVVLEVTEKCNLRCSYCVYSASVSCTRDHGVRDMSDDVARRAIDYLHQHSGRRQKVSLSFYGGEPLLRFADIREWVSYARGRFSPKPVDFALTTNGVLVTPESAAFLAENGFYTLLSIDGPQDVHDLHRRDARGRGSFAESLRGLRLLVEAYGRETRHIGLSMVYAPPFPAGKLDRIAAFLQELSWLPPAVDVRISYPNFVTYPADQIQEVETLGQWAESRFREAYRRGGNLPPLVRGLVEKTYAQLVQRAIFPRREERFFLNGCCVPGVRKVYVSTGGELLLCEKVYANAPALGDVWRGLDEERVRRVFITEYEKRIADLCAHCWAARLCDHCYIQGFTAGVFAVDKKRWNCDITRRGKETLLRNYCSLMEIDPQGMKPFREITLT